MDKISDLPMGFGMALLQNPRAMQRFYQMSRTQRQALVARTHSIQSKPEMKAFVDQLANPGE